MQFGYTVLFVADVEASVVFYERAFGFERRMVTQAFGMLQSGATTLAFGWEENERKELAASAMVKDFRPNSPELAPAGFQVSFIAEDVEAAYRQAVAAGAEEVYAPRLMPWGQWVSRVRDNNGILVSIVTTPRF